MEMEESVGGGFVHCQQRPRTRSTQKLEIKFLVLKGVLDNVKEDAKERKRLDAPGNKWCRSTDADRQKRGEEEGVRPLLDDESTVVDLEDEIWWIQESLVKLLNEDVRKSPSVPGRKHGRTRGLKKGENT